MITTMQMYWLVILDNVVGVSIWLAVLSFAFFMFAGVGAAVGELPKWPALVSVCVGLLALVTLTFVPSTKQMAAIIVVPKLANSEKVQTVGNQLYDLAVEWMEELRPKKEKK